MATLEDPSQPLAKPYQYKSVVRSLVTPPFKKWLVVPLVPFTPRWLPANAISIISFLFVIAALLLSLLSGMNRQLIFFTTAIFYIFYCIGDSLDGQQAVRTKTSSALGEFCDHFLDALATGAVVYTFLFLYKVNTPWIACSLLYCGYLGHALTMYEQYKTGCIQFDPLGCIEAVLLMSVFLLAGMNEHVFSFFTEKLGGKYTLMEYFLSINILGAILAFLKIYKRVGGISGKFALYMITSLILLLFGLKNLSIPTTFLLLSLHNARYICDLIHGNLVDGKERTPDALVATVFLLSFAFPQFSVVSPWIAFLLAWQVLLLLISCGRTLSYLRQSGSA